MMKKLTMFINLNEISFGVKNLKILYGDNYLFKYEILRKIERYFSKKSNLNDYEEDIIYLDSEPLSRNDYVFFKITSEYDLNEELKLGTKSLIKKYLELRLEALEYTEELNTLKILFDDLNNSYVDENINIKIEDYNIDFSFSELNLKTLSKLFSIKVTKMDEEINTYDLNYHLLILFQIRIIDYIIKYSNQNIFLAVDCYLDQYLLDEIKDMKLNNSIVIINTNINHNPENLSNYCLINKECYDLSDDLVLYKIIDNMEFYIQNIQKLKDIIKDYISGMNNYQIVELIKVL